MATNQEKSNRRGDYYQRIIDCLNQRETWENRQRLFYQARYFGVRRKVKPWPTAADLHVQLIDTAIERLKPSFVNSAIGNDILSSFVPMRQQLTPITVTAERWFDYKMREQSNFQKEIVSVIDNLLLYGRGVAKVVWDDQNKRIGFEAIDPFHLIVPQYTKELKDADFIVHIISISVDSYKTNPLYKQDEEFIKRIAGKPNNSVGLRSEIQDEIYRREGITQEAENDRIILWEMYTPSKDGWLVETYSPLAINENVRKPFTLPYEHGEPPFVDFPYEITGGGWYSPRGVAEILLPGENLLNKLKNSLSDYVELANRPVFEAQNPVSLNTANLRMQPGQILPQGLKPVQFSQPPFDFQRLMLEERQLAENRMGNADFGAGSQFNTGDRKTAAEIQAMQGQAAASGDLRNRIFRMSLAHLFRQSWALYVQYAKEDLMFRYADDTGQMVPEGIHEQYSIEPKGGLDFINRQFALQKSVARMQMFQGNPYINQGELVKSVLEQDDPSLVRKLFTDPQAGSGDQAEDQATEIATMLATGFPVAIKPSDDHKAHISVLFAFNQAAQMRQQPVDQSAIQVLMEHLQQHLAALEQTDPNTSRAIQKQLRDAAKPQVQQQGQAPQQLQPQVM
ncbi:MAG: hypothetical protein EBT26_05590 [Microbacteriaceae bacterium]|nr:hypothetical protein [Microbacteriaceae bacterium]NBS61499.1 hypothetical protein [Microbacteriaceae bacterium]